MRGALPLSLPLSLPSGEERLLVGEQSFLTRGASAPLLRLSAAFWQQSDDPAAIFSHSQAGCQGLGRGVVIPNAQLRAFGVLLTVASLSASAMISPLLPSWRGAIAPRRAIVPHQRCISAIFAPFWQRFAVVAAILVSRAGCQSLGRGVVIPKAQLQALSFCSPLRQSHPPR